MKSIAFKIVVSFIVVVLATIFVRFLTQTYFASEDGHVRVVIVDEKNDVVFDDLLIVLKGDSFEDVLDRHFNITCADSSYKADATCHYTFNIGGQENRVILGISNDTFEVMTDWNHTFLAFEQYYAGTYHMASLGPSHLAFIALDDDTQIDHIRISVKTVGDGSS